MRTFLKTAVAGFLGLAALGATAANAGNNSAHNNRYDDHYAHDRYYNAQPYRGSGVTFSVRYADGRYYSGYKHKKRRVVNREVFNTRYRARIVLIEEVVHRRRGPRLVCTVEARGPEARYVSKRRIHRIADRNCSPRARIRVFA